MLEKLIEFAPEMLIGLLIVILAFLAGYCLFLPKKVMTLTEFKFMRKEMARQDAKMWLDTIKLLKKLAFGTKQGGTMNQWLPEQLKSIECLCHIASILVKLKRDDLLPTVLEHLHELSQQIIEENCVNDK